MSFWVPAEQFAQLAVVTEAGDVTNAGEQNSLPHDGYGCEAGQDQAILGWPLLQNRPDSSLDLLDLVVEQAELAEHPLLGVHDGVGVGGQAGTVGSGQLEVHQTSGQLSSVALADNDTVKVARVGGSDVVGSGERL